MNLLKHHISTGNFSHAYLLVGDFETAKKDIFEASEKILSLGDATSKLEAHPDFSYEKFELFGVDDSHALRQRASQKPMFGEKKVFVIELISFSNESANALLKLLEEPFEGTHFFILTPFKENVLPTLMSRLVLVEYERKEGSDEKIIELSKKFLAGLPHERIALIKKEDLDRDESVSLLNEMELALANAPGSATLRLEIFEQIQKSREILSIKGSSAKMILEHMALVLPKV